MKIYSQYVSFLYNSAQDEFALKSFWQHNSTLPSIQRICL